MQLITNEGVRSPEVRGDQACLGSTPGPGKGTEGSGTILLVQRHDLQALSVAIDPETSFPSPDPAIREIRTW